MASDNIDALRALSADPLFIKETRVDAIAGLVQLMDTAYAAADAFPGPLLVMVGEHDEIVPPGAQSAMIERLRATPCVQVVYPDGWHLLLRDLQRRVVWQDILAWIDGEPLPSGQAASCGGEAVAGHCVGRVSACAPAYDGSAARSRSFGHAPLEQADDLGHHRAGIVVLGREHPGDAGGQELRRVLGRDDAADHHRNVVQPLGAQPRQDFGDLGAVRAGEDRQADHVHALLERGGGDARRRQADAVVDHLEAAVARAQRDLLGAVGMAIEPGLADQHLGAPAQALGQPVDPGAHAGEALLVDLAAGRRSPRSAPDSRRTPCAGSLPIRRW